MIGICVSESKRKAVCDALTEAQIDFSKSSERNDYAPIGLSGLHLSKVEIEALCQAYLFDIEMILSHEYGVPSVAEGWTESEREEERFAWERIMTFLHTGQVSQRRLCDVFWFHIVCRDPTNLEGRLSYWNRVYETIACRLAEIGVDVEEFRPSNDE